MNFATGLAKPIDNPQHISLLCPTRERPERLKNMLDSIEETVRDKMAVDIWIYVDRDDTKTQALKSDIEVQQPYSFSIGWEIGERTQTMGEMVNVLWRKSTTNAGIYMGMTDDYRFATSGWDDMLRAAFNRYPDRILMAYPVDPTVPDDEQVTFVILSAEWINVIGRVIPAYFPFWFEDAWIDSLGRLIQRKVRIDAMKMEPQGGKGKTPRMRNLPFWFRFSENTTDDRLEEADRLRKAIYGDNSAAYRESVRQAEPIVRQWQMEIEQRLRSPAPDAPLERLERSFADGGGGNSSIDPVDLIKESSYLAVETNAVDRLCKKAHDAIVARQYDRALRWLDNVARSSRSIKDCQYWRAVCWQHLQRWEEAEKAALAELAMQPNHPIVTRLLDNIRASQQNQLTDNLLLEKYQNWLVSVRTPTAKEDSLPTLKIDVICPENIGHVVPSFIGTMQTMGLLGRAFVVNPQNYQSVFDYLQQIESDFILLMHGDHHLSFLSDSEEKRQRWQAVNVPTVCICGEVTLNSLWPGSIEKSSNARECFDYFLCIDERDMSFFAEKTDKVCFLPAFVDGSQFQPRKPLAARKNCLFFFGSTNNFGVQKIYELRRQLLDQLLSTERLDFFTSPLGKYGDVEPLIDLYNSYTATIALPSNGQGWGYTNRIYEASACGTLAFHYRLEKQPITTQLFKEYYHYIPYDIDNFPKLIEDIDYYIQHLQELQEIAERGRKEVSGKHTTQCRIEQIVKYVATGEKIEHQLLPELKSSESLLKTCYRAVQMQPNSAENYLKLGNILQAVGKVEEAQRAYAKVSQLNPDFGINVK